ncbi:MAG: hypothetical protein ACLP1Q_15085 [Solirubrobacteraceae bacterium]
MDERGGQEGGCEVASGRARSLLRAALLALLALAVACTCASAAAEAQPASRLRVGTQTLTLCQSAPLAYCGTLPVPLDYGTAGSPQISIAYRW